MADMTEDDFNHLQGRIIAVEFLARAWLVGEAMKKPDPVLTLQNTKNALYASMQGIERPFDETSDAIWSQAIEALDLHFQQAEFRVKSLME